MGIKRDRVIITRKAQRSIKEIYEFIKDHEKSAEKAHQVRKAIINKCFELKTFSGYSKEPYLEKYPGDYRSVSIWNFIIIFTVTEKDVRVLNVVHSSQNPDSRTNI
jgi:plasmid stabilization system protein ParE